MTKRLRFHFSLSGIGEGNGNPLQCSCLENPRDGGAWWAAVYGVAQSRTRLKRLSSSSSNSIYRTEMYMYICKCVYIYIFVVVLVIKLCLTLFLTPWSSRGPLGPHDPIDPSRLLCPWDFPGKNTGVGCHSRGSSWPRDRTCISCIGRWILYHWATREAYIYIIKWSK